MIYSDCSPLLSQNKKWESTLQDIQAQHESEKNWVGLRDHFLALEAALIDRNLMGRSCYPAVAERAEQDAVVRVRPRGARPEAGETPAGEGANHQGSEGAGWHSSMISAQCDHVEGGSEAEGQPLFRIS